MLAELNQSIAISQQILSLLGGSSSQVAPPAHPRISTYVSAMADSGLALIRDSRVPPPLMSQLHETAQKHFKVACLDLLTSHPRGPLPLVQQLAFKLKETYTILYGQKVAEMVAVLKRVHHPTQKQPYATDILLYAFEQSQSPTRREREVLASLTGLKLEQVRVWFQNRRQRTKKRAAHLEPRPALKFEDLLARVAAAVRPVECEDDFDDNDSGYCSGSEHATPLQSNPPITLSFPSMGPRSYPAPYVPQELSTEFRCDQPVFERTPALHPPVHAQVHSVSDLTRLMSRLTLRHRREAARSSTGSTSSSISVVGTSRSPAKGRKAVANTSTAASSTDAPGRKKATRKDPETGRKVAGRRGATTPTTPFATSSPPSDPSSSSLTIDTSVKPRKRAGPLRRKPAGTALARQASGSSVVSTSSSDSSRSTSYSSDFSLASDSSFTSVESVPTAASMDCFQPQQQPQFDPLAAFDFTQLFSSQPSDILPQPVADFELPPDLLAGPQMPMDTSTATLHPPESTDFFALLNDPTIQDLLQSVQDMDVVAPQQMQESSTLNNTLDFGSVDTSAFLDLSASTLPTFDAMFGLDTSSFQDTLWSSPGFSLPITV